MGKLYYCDYCDRSFVDDLQARKKHLQSTAHIRNRKMHYLYHRDLETLIEEESVKEECYQFKNSGQCRFGENCFRSHFTKQQLNNFKIQIAEQKRYKDFQELSELKTVASWLEKRSTILPHETPSNMEKSSNIFHNVQQGIRQSLPLSLLPHNLYHLMDAEVSEWG